MIYSVKRTSIFKGQVMEYACVWVCVSAICAGHMVTFVLVIIHSDFMLAPQYQNHFVRCATAMQNSWMAHSI